MIKAIVIVFMTIATLGITSRAYSATAQQARIRSMTMTQSGISTQADVFVINRGAAIQK